MVTHHLVFTPARGTQSAGLVLPQPEWSLYCWKKTHFPIYLIISAESVGCWFSSFFFLNYHSTPVLPFPLPYCCSLSSQQVALQIEAWGLSSTGLPGQGSAAFGPIAPVPYQWGAGAGGAVVLTETCSLENHCSSHCIIDNPHVLDFQTETTWIHLGCFSNRKTEIVYVHPYAHLWTHMYVCIYTYLLLPTPENF